MQAAYEHYSPYFTCFQYICNVGHFIWQYQSHFIKANACPLTEIDVWLFSFLSFARNDVHELTFETPVLYKAINPLFPRISQIDHSFVLSQVNHISCYHIYRDDNAYLLLERENYQYIKRHILGRPTTHSNRYKILKRRFTSLWRSYIRWLRTENNANVWLWLVETGFQRSI